MAFLIIVSVINYLKFSFLISKSFLSIKYNLLQLLKTAMINLN